MLKITIKFLFAFILSLIFIRQDSYAQLIKPKKPEDCDILFVAQKNRLFPNAKYKINKKCTIALYKFIYPENIKEKYKNIDIGYFNLFQAKISNALIASNYFDVISRKPEDMQEVLTSEQNLWSSPTSFQTTAATNFGKMYGVDLGVIFEVATLNFDHTLTRIRNAEFEEKINGRISLSFKTINLITGKIVCENTIQTRNETKNKIMFANNNIDYQQSFEDLLDKSADQFSEIFIKCSNHKDLNEIDKTIIDFEKPLVDILQITINNQTGSDINYTASLRYGIDNKIVQNDILDLLYKNSIIEITIGKCIITSINSGKIQSKLTTDFGNIYLDNKADYNNLYYCRRIK